MNSMRKDLKDDITLKSVDFNRSSHTKRMIVFDREHLCAYAVSIT